MRLYISKEEIDTRIKLNFSRLSDSCYDINNVFKGDDAGWPGDWEGRALLAFVSLYKINSAEIPCMKLMIDKIPEVTGNKCYYGEKTGDVIFEQQLSGLSWYLRGLCEYYEQFKDERVIEYLNKTFEDVYLPTIGRYSTYPLKRDLGEVGGVGGHSTGITDGWKLSSDVGCAFMSIDGLSHYYKITRNPKALMLLEEMAEVFDKIDKFTLKAQTHCTLTAGRGFMRMYDVTDNVQYLKKAQRVFDLYVSKGMTYTYQNFNWFNRGDTWTEPCAIVDSLMLAMLLYKATNDNEYRTYAARIYFNGFATMQRPNGGAGTDTTVSDTTDTLKVGPIYEAYFCCSMRLSEGLWFINENLDSFFAETTGLLKKDKYGRYTDGDIVYAQISEAAEKYADEPKFADGYKLYSLIKFYKLKNEKVCRSIEQKVLFN